MTTDPRIAALAAALEAYFGPSWWPGLTDVTIIAADTTVAAEKILAALPPDWCGHDPDDAGRTALYILALDNQNAEIARLRDDLAHCERAWEDAGNEIARLRVIEEAAAAVTAYYDPERVEPHDSDAPLHTLAATLGRKR